MVYLLLAAFFVIQIGRSIRAGVPIGFTQPRRDERPGQFWLAIIIMAMPVMWLAIRTWDIVY